MGHGGVSDRDHHKNKAQGENAMCTLCVVRPYRGPEKSKEPL